MNKMTRGLSENRQPLPAVINFVYSYSFFSFVIIRKVYIKWRKILYFQKNSIYFDI